MSLNGFQVKPTPVFVDGDREAGWCIIYEYPDGKLKDGINVFDTKKEATKIMKLGGEYEGEFSLKLSKMVSQVTEVVDKLEMFAK